MRILFKNPSIKHFLKYLVISIDLHVIMTSILIQVFGQIGKVHAYRLS